MQYSDRPISRPKDDLFGRAGFALQLARAIDQLEIASDGFAIAIQGVWGSGKTSVIELLVRYLAHIEMERASHHQILDDAHPVPKTILQLDEMADVFGKIAARLDALDKAGKNLTYWERINRIAEFRRWLGSEEDAQIADRYWRLKVKVQSEPRTTVVRFSPWLIAGHAELASALLAELARALGDRLGSNVKQAFGAILVRLAELAPLAGVAFDLASGARIGNLFSTGGDWAKGVASRMTSGETLDATMRRLRGALGQLAGQRVLVVVDDLDRLTPTEALRMVSLVKSLGDLPNVIYLLSYDEDKLAQLLNKKLKVDGREFLEKIVQYQVVLPPVQDDDLIQLLNADLEKLVGELSDSQKRRLGLAWPFVLRYYVQTPRDLRRFVNSVAIALSALGDHLDPVDVIFIEAIRLYDDQAYWWIRQHLGEITS
jgi:predicted KAP-like P-loop ATPase